MASSSLPSLINLGLVGGWLIPWILYYAPSCFCIISISLLAASRKIA